MIICTKWRFLYCINCTKWRFYNKSTYSKLYLTEKGCVSKKNSLIGIKKQERSYVGSLLLVNIVRVYGIASFVLFLTQDPKRFHFRSIHRIRWLIVKGNAGCDGANRFAVGYFYRRLDVLLDSFHFFAYYWFAIYRINTILPSLTTIPFALVGRPARS